MSYAKKNMDADLSSALAAEATDLRTATFRLARRIRAQRAVDRMSDGQFTVLATLKVHGPHTLGELADRERVSAPSMTRTVNCMAEDGLVEKVPHPDDGRQVLVRATEAGEAVVRETIAQRDSWMLAHIEGLDAAQLALLRQAADLLLEVSDA